MRKLTIILAFLFSGASYADTAKLSAGIPDFKKQPFINIYRNDLFKNGWKPIINHTMENLSDDEIVDPYTKDFIKMGIVEVDVCSGTGMAPCVFLYKRQNQCIEVHTIGEFFPGEKLYPGVTSVEAVSCPPGK
jgi:hypothetical protein